MSESTWRKSSRSATNAQCVELAVAGGRTAVRDSKNRGAGTLVFTSRAFRAFLDGARR
ncbi:DUF397 domain-containing protein [Saccharothrix coeruleofusca]|uniref:DUF397 domain-containing protein n=1 Tax=Saccharothrix coeruleofusca TaxID=33919 RepID=A0A918AH89_9PSEU|nr:DUF397 domain-containing protein [Saccharothrix coeruleofusca]MBP2340296.1 hypothetical protein [Saccharothrix coeruleofusca]GGP36349.1 hypothetical protein GCM10010185_04310 [Saccharothrix coeruleofusca]